MADSFTPNLNLRKPEVGAANDTWGGVAGLNGDMDLLDALFAPGGGGTSVGVNVGTGKTMQVGGTLTVIAGGILNAILGAINVAASMLSIKDDADTSKILKFNLAGITAATTRTLTVPNADTTIVGTNVAQTLTLKTLTDAVANTQAPADNSTKVATTAFVQAEIATAVAAPALWSTGDIKVTWKTVADAGWLMVADQTIGSATSGATFASATAQALFLLLWTNISNADAPVSGGRGVSAAADWAANKTLTLSKMLGRTLGVGGAGAGLTARALGSVFGEENHVLTANENGPHSHGINGDANPGSGTVTASLGPGGNPFLFATLSSGLGTPHNTMQPTSFVNVMVKL